MGTSYYEQAAVCSRGHVQTMIIAGGEVPAHCPDCGAPVLTTCPACGFRLRGYEIVPGFVGTGSDETISSFCDRCGSAFPWADRKARIYELHNLLDKEELDSATELIIREQLDALTGSELDEAAQISRWQRIKTTAPPLFAKIATHPVFTSVASAEVKKQLGLPLV